MKERIIENLKKLLNWIEVYLTKGEGDYARNFRIFVILIWVNVLGFFVLSNAGLLSVLNPLKFLDFSPKDKRKEIVLFFPGSIEELHEKTESHEKTRIVELRQKTDYNDDYKSPGREQRLLKNAKMILQQLMTSPDSIRGVTAIKDGLIIKSVWYFEDKLIVHLDKKLIDQMDKDHSSIMLACIQKSLQANLGAFINIHIVIQ